MSRENDSPEERERVYQKIARHVLEFRDANLGRDFHAEELRAYVLGQAPEIAPDSPGRILRDLRLQGLLDYIVINRRESLYRFLPPVGELYCNSLLVRVTGATPKGRPFVAGMLLDPDIQRVVFAAPILAHLVGQPRDKLRRTFERLGWRACIVPRRSPG